MSDAPDPASPASPPRKPAASDPARAPRRPPGPFAGGATASHLVGLLVFVGVGIVLPFLFPTYRSLGITLLLFVGWAAAWDVLGGWAGQVSLGHAAFIGIGSYAVALGSSRFGLGAPESALIGCVIAGVLAWFWGLATFRLRGAYFVLSTIAVAEILRLVAINERWLTGGAQGIFIFSLPEPFGLDLFDRSVQYYMSLGFAALVLAVVIALARSRFGYRMRAVREDEESAMAAGIDPASIKRRAFVVSAVLTALGGGIYGIFLSFLEPHFIFFLPLSVQVALTAIIGGRGTVWGPMAGALLLVVSGEVFRNTFADANLLIYGVLIVVVTIYLPRGMIGELTRWVVRRRYARGARS